MEPFIFLQFFFSLSDLLSLSDCTPVSETILGSNGFCHLIYPEPITRSVLVPQIDTLDYTIFFLSLDLNLQAYGANNKDWAIFSQRPSMSWNLPWLCKARIWKVILSVCLSLITLYGKILPFALLPGTV